MALNLLAPLGAASPLVTGGVTSGESGYTQQIFASPLPSPPSGVAMGVGTAYFVYVLYTTFAITPKFVRFQVSTAGIGAQTAEIGLFSTPVGPNGAGQSLSKLVSTGTVADLTTTGAKSNSSAFSTSIPAGTHLWAGLRTSMATSQITCPGLAIDINCGFILQVVSASALTGAGPWTGALIPVNIAADAPLLRVTLF